MIRVPGSKSITHRAFVLAGASDQPCTITGALRSADTNATLACVQELGATATGDVTITPGPAGGDLLDCMNAGTGLRLLSAQAALHDRPYTLTGDASLQARPNGPLLAALRELGATVTGDRAPFTVQGPIHAGHVTLPAQTSSQFASALLLALPQVDGDSALTLQQPIASAPYLDITLDTLAAFGIKLTRDDNRFHIPGQQVPRCAHFEVEPDWSTAAFPLAAGALLGAVTVAGLRSDSAQGDKRILEYLRAFGAKVEEGPNGIRVQHDSLISPGTIDIQDTPDMFPMLTILAAASQGTTTFTGGAALRHKESDRICAMADGLTQMGIDVKEQPDGLQLTGGTLQGATINSHGDHRVHMAFAIAAKLARGHSTISEPESVAVSYPNFHEDLRLVEAA